MANQARPYARHACVYSVLLLSACAGLRPSTADEATRGVAVPSTADPFANPFVVALRDTARPMGVYVRLSDAGLRAAVATESVPSASPLSEDEAQAALLRMAGPAIDGPASEPFRFAPRSLPAPRPGTTTRGSFAGPGGTGVAGVPTVLASGPLRDHHEIAVPTDSLGPPRSAFDLILAREGARRLYYRVGLSHAPAGRRPPIDRGFEVLRSYEAIDDPEDVRQDEDGTWRVRLGARVRVRIRVANAGARYHVAVVDPPPAGLEAVNSALAGTVGLLPPASPASRGQRGRAAPGGRATAADTRSPTQHQNVRAERVETYTTLLAPGRREITYLALATTPGDFAAPATRAEEMYAPETFGRGEAGRLVVEPRTTSSRQR